MKRTLAYLFFFFQFVFSAQTDLRGTVIGVGGTKLPFVNIGILHKNIGTVSSETGLFSIHIPEKNCNDTLSFFYVGYESLHIPVKKILANGLQTFQLRIKPVSLNEVVITSDKAEERRYGIKKLNPKIHFIDASVNHDDIFEIAQVIELGPETSRLTSVNLLLNIEDRAGGDTAIFRINFYEFDGKKPGKRLSETHILQKHPVRSGWLKFDLQNYSIRLKGAVAVAIEFIPSQDHNRVSYDVKIGGSSKSFVRARSLGDWNIPPHHYRLFVTAVGNGSNNPAVEDDAEEKETPPTTRFFSKNVGDTFSLFVSLPESSPKFSKEKPPVVFLLDANFYFDAVKASVKIMNAKKLFKEPVIIGIGYKNAIENDSLRDRDYSYPKALAKDSFYVSGGAGKFLAFIEQELIPYVEKQYNTDPAKRTLMGHSLGGYFCLYALQQNIGKPYTFTNYIAGSPSLEYHDRFLFSAYQNSESGKGGKGNANLVITTGAMEKEDQLFDSFTKILAGKQFRGLRSETIVYPDADHMGTAIPSFEKGLEKILHSGK